MRDHFNADMISKEIGKTCFALGIPCGMLQGNIASTRELYRKNSAVDMLTVCEELKSRQSLDMVGGRAYIATLTAEVPATANGREYAKIIAEKAVMRQMIRTAEDITEKGYQSKMAAREILDYAESGIFQIAQRRQKNDYTKIQDVLLENLKIIDAAAQNKDKITGIPTGFHDLDEKTSGLQRSDLIIVAARPETFLSSQHLFSHFLQNIITYFIYHLITSLICLYFISFFRPFSFFISKQKNHIQKMIFTFFIYDF